MDPSVMRFGATSETVREALSLTQRDVSERLTEIGRPMSVQTLSQIETGGRRVDVDDLVALASALEVAPDLLLSIDPLRTTVIVRRGDDADGAL